MTTFRTTVLFSATKTPSGRHSGAHGFDRIARPRRVFPPALALSRGPTSRSAISGSPGHASAPDAPLDASSHARSHPAGIPASPRRIALRYVVVTSVTGRPRRDPSENTGSDLRCALAAARTARPERPNESEGLITNISASAAASDPPGVVKLSRASIANRPLLSGADSDGEALSPRSEETRSFPNGRSAVWTVPTSTRRYAGRVGWKSSFWPPTTPTTNNPSARSAGPATSDHRPPSIQSFRPRFVTSVALAYAHAARKTKKAGEYLLEPYTFMATNCTMYCA